MYRIRIAYNAVLLLDALLLDKMVMIFKMLFYDSFDKVWA